jgi:hypothetical protein
MSGATVNLQKDFSGDGNRRTWTYSTWFKLSNITQSGFFNWGKGNPEFSLRFESATSDTSNNYFRVSQYDGSQDLDLVTTQYFRDPSAWGHMVVAFDTTQGTASNRIKIYFNGTQITSFSTESYPDQNFETFVNQASKKHYIGYADYQPINGYLCETVFIDGTQLDATSFGEFDSDSPNIWKPKDVSGLTFGTNGYYLQYKEAGTSQNASGIGADTSGNNNHFACDDVVATDQATDTCTNNFCTWNSLDTFYSGNTYQEGNTQGTKPNNSVESFGTSTFGISSGKWYVEFKVISFSGSNSTIGFGLIDRPSIRNDMEIGKYTYGITYKNNGYIYANDGGTHSTDSGETYGAGDIVGLYIDLDNLEFYFAKNGTLLNSGTGFAIQPLSSTINGVYFFGFDNFANGGSVHQANWGNPAFAISSGNQDDNGYGNFEYSPNITGDGVAKKFYALCTKNLAEFG